MKSKNEPDIELSKVELDRMVNSDAPNDRQNFITDDVSLITDNSLYRKNMPLQRIYQTANPEIILVMQGNADYNVNNLPYKLGKGDLFIVPIGTIFQVRFRSDDFKLKVIDYHLNQDNKMNYYALWLKRHHLTESDFFRVNHYYELIHECYSSHMEMRESVVYIVLALLHDINRILAKDGNQTVTLKREEQVYVDFMKLLMEDLRHAATGHNLLLRQAEPQRQSVRNYCKKGKRPLPAELDKPRDHGHSQIHAYQRQRKHERHRTQGGLHRAGIIHTILQKGGGHEPAGLPEKVHGRETAGGVKSAISFH